MAKEMTPKEWDEICSRVTDAMRTFTQAFVTPITTETPDTVRLLGSGSYIWQEGKRFLLTCEHVVVDEITRVQRPTHYRFSDSEDIFEHRGPWCLERHPKDAALALITDAAWNATEHNSAEILKSKFAPRHAPELPEELLFFRGYAGENSRYGFATHIANGTGYCSQEAANSGDDQIFEILWDPKKAQFSSETGVQATKEIKRENPRGFSGSLVWNTRYLEVTAAGKRWSPEDAVVTGLLRRWDEDDTGNLLAWRIEHLNEWLKGS